MPFGSGVVDLTSATLTNATLIPCSKAGARNEVSVLDLAAYILAGAPPAPSGANPSASVGLAAIDGIASTFLRSDGAPALDQAIAPTWTGLHTFANKVQINALPSTVGLAVKVNATTPSDPVQVQNSSGTKILFVDSNGFLRCGVDNTVDIGDNTNALFRAVYSRSFKLASGIYNGSGITPDAGSDFTVASIIKVLWSNGQVQIPQSVTNAPAFLLKGFAARTVAIATLQTSAGASLGNIGGEIFEDFVDAASTHTDGTEDDLYTHTTVANNFAVNGDAIRGGLTIKVIGHATATRKIKGYFGGIAIFDSTALTFAANTTIRIEYEIIRKTSTTLRATVWYIPNGGTPLVQYTSDATLTGLTLSSTNIVKFTGAAAAAGAASGDITAVQQKISNQPSGA